MAPPTTRLACFHWFLRARAHGVDRRGFATCRGLACTGLQFSRARVHGDSMAVARFCILTLVFTEIGIPARLRSADPREVHHESHRHRGRLGAVIALSPVPVFARPAAHDACRGAPVDVLHDHAGPSMPGVHAAIALIGALVAGIVALAGCDPGDNIPADAGCPVVCIADCPPDVACPAIAFCAAPPGYTCPHGFKPISNPPRSSNSPSSRAP